MKGYLMFIKKIVFENHSIFENTTFDFCDSLGKPYDTIILAGENGTGKSTLLNVIFNFLNNFLPSIKSNYKTTFFFELTDGELAVFRENADFKNRIQGYEVSGELIVEVDHSIMNDWGALKPTISRKEDGVRLEFYPGIFSEEAIRSQFKAVFSDVEVSYHTDQIASTTSLDIDMGQNVVKSTASIAKEVTQLLIDIEALDNGDLSEWADENPEANVSDRPRDTRMKRFKDAFESIFPTKRYNKVINTPQGKIVQFEEFGKKMSISDLSSGEKQIVFRGSFLLRNKLSTIGAFVLIDEPEISLHPSWQLKILDFYKTLFKDDQGRQTSQLFVATHSSFVIHNNTRMNDKVLILKKDAEGRIYTPEIGKFYNWSGEEAVKEAFDITMLQERVLQSPKHLIITEGKTDWKHLKRALSKIRETMEIEDNFEFLEYEDEVEMGSSQLVTLCQSLSKINHQSKIIAIFDRDEPAIINKISLNNGESFKHWGNGVYSFPIPVPPHRTQTNICIEHYYSDEEVKTQDRDSRRLFIGNEFCRNYGIHNDKDKICANRNKCGEGSIQIIDDGVCKIDRQETNIALSKNKFAQYILEEDGPFQNVNFTNFIPIFSNIRAIIECVEE
jgi:predicted ATP-binding protein involved in virulence